MWHTNNGDRTLDGAEALLFAHALWDFVQELELSEGEDDVGLPVFDRMTYGQKASVIFSRRGSIRGRVSGGPGRLRSAAERTILDPRGRLRRHEVPVE